MLELCKFSAYIFKAARIIYWNIVILVNDWKDTWTYVLFLLSWHIFSLNLIALHKYLNIYWRSITNKIVHTIIVFWLWIVLLLFTVYKYLFSLNYFHNVWSWKIFVFFFCLRDAKDKSCYGIFHEFYFVGVLHFNIIFQITYTYKALDNEMTCLQ